MNRSTATRPSVRALLLWGLGISLVVACVLSLFASGSPDGLEFVAGQQGFDGTASESPLARGPLADYAVAAFGEGMALPGAIIVGATGIAAVFALTWLVSGRRRAKASS